jgi:SNF2 family DNA or RNA helicase
VFVDSTRHKSWELLFQFQKDGILKVDGEPSALIADEMGLGKTLSGIARDQELRYHDKMPKAHSGATLIVAPSGTHWNTWLKEIVRYCGPDTVVWIIDRKKRQLLERGLSQAVQGKSDFPEYVIIHYEALRLMPVLKEVEWFHVILDECHRIKNRAAQQTRAVKALRTHNKTGLSGTPADDKPQDLWSVLNWLFPRLFRSYWKFVNQCCIFEADELQKLKYGRTFKKIVGINPDGVEELLTTIRPYYVRRNKDQVGIELPEMTWTERWVTLPPAQRRAYDQMRKDMIAWVGEHKDEPLVAGAVVAQLVRLQQFALATVDFQDEYVSDRFHAGREEDRGLRRKVVLTDPSVKLDDLEEIIEGNPNESIVVFSQSRSMSHLAVRRLESRGILARPYTGDVPQQARDAYEYDFQKGNIQVLCCTIRAGGEGITLHRSSTVVFFDRDWNPTRNRQAEKRVHRIGQIHPVQVIDIMARDTVDLGRKQRIANKWEALEWILGDKVPDRIREAYANA